MPNAFNMITRQAVLDDCATFFPEILPWVSWCHGSHTTLWNPLDKISSELGVQQWDSLGPMLFALVFHKLATTIDADDKCFHLHIDAWYLNYEVLEGDRSAVLHLIKELGPHLGLPH